MHCSTAIQVKNLLLRNSLAGIYTNADEFFVQIALLKYLIAVVFHLGCYILFNFLFVPWRQILTELPSNKLPTFPPPLSLGLGGHRHSPYLSTEPKVRKMYVPTVLVRKIKLE